MIIVSYIQSVNMESNRQNFVFSNRDKQIARSHHKVKIWEDDLKTIKKNQISIPQYMGRYLYDSFFDPRMVSMVSKKAKSLTHLVTTEISRRLANPELIKVNDLAQAFRGYNDGLGNEKMPCDVNELIQNAIDNFGRFRSFYEQDDLFSTHFMKSNYSMWSDIRLSNETKCLYGKVDAAYWINEQQRRVGIINWCTSGNLDAEIRIEIRESPFFGSHRTVFQKKQCDLHLCASILETNYDLTVSAYIVNLKSENYDKISVNNWRECQCVSLFEFLALSITSQ